MEIGVSKDLVRMTAFERYMLCEELEGRPMVFPLVWKVLGGIDVSALISSFQEALSWHPLLTARIEGTRWFFGETPTPTVTFLNDDQVADHFRAIDCRRGPMIRCFVWKEQGQQFIEFIFHHIASDGISAIEFCGDVFSLYDCRIHDKAKENLRQPDVSLLSRRKRLFRPKRQWASRWRTLKLFGCETMRFSTTRAEEVRPADLEPTELEVGAASAPWRLSERNFDEDFTNTLRQKADDLGASINDWCLVSMFRAILHWNEKTGVRHIKETAGRNCAGTDAPPCAKHISASNMIGFAFVARRREMLVDGHEAVKSIAAQRKVIQKEALAGLFNAGVGALLPLPGALRLSARWSRPATFVLTHVGDPVRRFRNPLPRNREGFATTGNLVLRGLMGAAPTRPGTHLAGLVSVFNGKLHVCLRVEPSALSRSEGEQIIDIWKREIRGLLEA